MVKCVSRTRFRRAGERRRRRGRWSNLLTGRGYPRDAIVASRPCYRVRDGCLTARSVGCLHLSRGASLRLFIDRCQQLVRKTCVRIERASLQTCADSYIRAFKQGGRGIFEAATGKETRRLISRANKKLCDLEGRTQKSTTALAGLETEAGCHD